MARQRPPLKAIKKRPTDVGFISTSGAELKLALED